MRKNLVVTVTGNDKVGIVEEVTGLMLNYGANVESSKMARLGGEFAMLMLVSVSAERFDELREGVRGLRDDEYKISTRETSRGAQKFAGWQSCDLEVRGADHEGLIHEITSYLAEQGVSVESMDTGSEPAPMSGGTLFTMSAVVLVPPALDVEALQDDLEDVGNRINVDTSLSASSSL